MDVAATSSAPSISAASPDTDDTWDTSATGGDAKAISAASASKEWKKGWEETDRLARESFVSWATDGSSAAKKIGDTLKKALLSAIYEATIKPIAIQIYSTAAGAMGLSAPAGAVDTASGIGSWLNAGSSASSAYSAYGTLTGSIMGSSAAYGAAIGTTSIGAGSQAAMLAAQTGEFGYAGVAATSDAAATAGAGASSALGAIPVAGWIALAVFAAWEIWGNKGGGQKTEGYVQGTIGDNSQLSYDYSNNHTQGNAVDQVKSAAQIAATGISTFVQSLGGNATGLGVYLGYNTDPNGTAPDNVASGLKDQSGKWIYDQGQNVDRGQAAQGMTDAIAQMTLAAAQAVDLGPILNPLLDALGSVAAMTKEQVTATLAALSAIGPQTVAQYTKVFGGAMDVSQLSALTKTGENVVQTFQRVNAEFVVTNSLAEMLGKDASAAFGAVGLASASARESLIAAMGGVQSMATTTQSYYQNFYSDAERHAIDLKAMDQSLTQLGVTTIPQTDAQFRALVEAQDLSTAAGQKMFVSLMGLSAGFDAVTKSVQAVTEDAFATLVDYERAQGTGNVGIGYVPTRTVPAVAPAPSDPALLKMIDTLRAELQAGQIALAQYMSQTAKILQRWNGDGMPGVRTV